MSRVTETVALALTVALAGCVAPSQGATQGPAGSTASQPRPQVITPPPMRPAQTQQPQSRPGFRAPQIMRLPGLEQVIGSSAKQLERRFGKARLNVAEGDALKLQFTGEPCVLDVYLYPTSPGATPTATHVEARRASDGRNVDRASCVEALRRR